MRKIRSEQVAKAVEELYSKINIELPKDVAMALKKAARQEKGRAAKWAIDILVKNADIAAKEWIPVCQDTGLAIVFIDVGQQVNIEGDSLEDAINKGVRNAVKKYLLRASVVKSPLDRKNTADNTPAIIHTRIVPGNKIKISVMAKGAGSENMSAIKMLKPSDGEDGIVDFVLDTVKKAGPNPCPPIVVGIGVGGNFEKCACLAKRSLLRKIGDNNRDKIYAALEKKLLKEINKLGIGTSGFGGKTTCLNVSIETAPCHIASLPLAVNIECHAHRHGTRII